MMFRKHPLRDFMVFILLGMTLTFAFNVQAVEATDSTMIKNTFLTWQAAYK